MVVTVDQRLVYHELYEKILYILTDIKYVEEMDDEKIKDFLNKYRDLISFDDDNFHSLLIYYFYDFNGNYYLPLSQADRYNDKYFKVFSKIIVQGNIENLIEMDMKEIIVYFNNVFSYYYDETLPRHILLYIAEECVREFENKNLTMKFRLYIMENKLRKN